MLLPTLPRALHSATGTHRVSTGETHRGTSQEVPRAGLSPGTGKGFGTVVPTDTRWPRESGSGPKGLRGAKLSDASAQRLCGTSQPPRAPRASRSEPFVEVDGLQPWVFLPDLSLDFRLQTAHGHRAAEGTRMQGMEGGHLLGAPGWETTRTPQGHCPHGSAQTFGSALLRVHRDTCVHRDMCVHAVSSL